MLALLLCLPAPALALDYVTLKRNEREISVAGKVVVEAEDGGILLMAADGVLWAIEPSELVRHTADKKEFGHLSADQMADRMIEELPEGFQVHRTAHYVICYNTTRAYAQWCGALYERLYRAFTNFWSRRGFELHEPQLPLVALVFADRRSYQSYAKRELGDAVGSIVGYYSFRTNRVTMYDLTGVESLRTPGGRRGSTAQINQMLSQPSAEPMVATIIHEATHQIAFNCGLQTRYSDVPLWVSEGIAVYFETPDLKSSRGWRGIGAVNRPRLNTFRKQLARRDSGTLVSLLVDDKRMRHVDTAAAAYAEAWALNYYLINRRPQEFLDYLKVISAKNPLIWNNPEQRMAEFRKAFGDDLDKLDADFVRYIRTLR